MAESGQTNGAHKEEEDLVEDEEEGPLSPGIETVEQVADILERVEDYSTVLPDSVTENILQQAGFSSKDTQVSIGPRGHWRKSWLKPHESRGHVTSFDF